MGTDNNAITEHIGRMQQLQTLLAWEGRLNNARIRQLFGLSTPRASVWIRALREAHPDWVRWDARNRSYIATPSSYAQAGAETSLDRYIGIVGLSNTIEPLTGSPTLQAAFPALATPRAEIFGPINRAIQAQASIEILYSSLQHPEPHRRVIHPHRLVRTDQRWHVRAYCEKNDSFRDFNLGRIREVRATNNQHFVSGSNDTAWHTLITVRFVAHPDLAPAQARVVREEYFAGAASRVETCRAPLVHYFIRSVQAAVDPAKHTPPEHVLAVFNTEELAPWLLPT